VKQRERLRQKDNIEGKRHEKGAGKCVKIKQIDGERRWERRQPEKK